MTRISIYLKIKQNEEGKHELFNHLQYFTVTTTALIKAAVDDYQSIPTAGACMCSCHRLIIASSSKFGHAGFDVHIIWSHISQQNSITAKVYCHPLAFFYSYVLGMAEGDGQGVRSVAQRSSKAHMQKGSSWLRRINEKRASMQSIRPIRTWRCVSCTNKFGAVSGVHEIETMLFVGAGTVRMCLMPPKKLYSLSALAQSECVWCRQMVIRRRWTAEGRFACHDIIMPCAKSECCSYLHDGAWSVQKSKSRTS